MRSDEVCRIGSGIGTRRVDDHFFGSVRFAGLSSGDFQRPIRASGSKTERLCASADGLTRAKLNLPIDGSCRLVVLALQDMDLGNL